MEKLGIAGDNCPQPVGHRWTTPCTGCGSPRCPQSVEIVRPRFHRPLSWAEARGEAALWTQFGTTPQSPGCGRKKVTESVESGRNQAGNRTPDGERPYPRGRGRPHGRWRGRPHRRRHGRPTAGAGAALGRCRDRSRVGVREGAWCCRRRSVGAATGPLGRRHGSRAAGGGQDGPPPPRALRPRSGQGLAERPPGTRRGAPGNSSRRRLGAAVRPASAAGQPFLIRLVSSVTWL